MTRLKPPTSCQDLADDPRHVLTWLRAKKPRSVVTKDTLSNEHCLFANLCKAHGFDVDIAPFLAFDDNWTCRVIDDLPTGKNITAAEAYAAVKRAIKEKS